jgi:bacterioferritin-associated ferredoxin
MTEPTSLSEYLERFERNQVIDGWGLAVRVHLPCPFCAAPDFLVYRMTEVEAAMTHGAMCAACGRSAKALIIRAEGELSLEVVQTSGPDQPVWMVPKMRRLE